MRLCDSAFFFFDVVCALSFMNFILRFEAVFRLRLSLALVVPTIILANLVILFAHFSLIFESFCVPEGIKAVVGGGAAWRDASNHDNLARLFEINERVSEDESKL